MTQYVPHVISASDVEDLARQINAEFERVQASLRTPSLNAVQWDAIVDEPRHIPDIEVMVASSVTWNVNQNLQRGAYIWNDAQSRWDKS